MPMSSKFLTESTGEKIVKIGQYLAKIWKKYDSLLFGPPCISPHFAYFFRTYLLTRRDLSQLYSAFWLIMSIYRGCCSQWSVAVWYIVCIML